jgi:leucyl aminopeptidase
MITVTYVQAAAAKKADCFVYLIEDGDLKKTMITQLEKEYAPGLGELVTARKFTGKKGQVLEVAGVQQSAKTLVLLGIGKQPTVESLRRATGTAVRVGQKIKAKTVALFVPATGVKETTAYVLEQITIAAHLSGYHFDEYKTDVETHGHKILNLFVLLETKEKKGLHEAIERGTIIAEGVNTTRYWVDLPPSTLTPTQLADKAEAIAKKHGLKITVFDEPTIKKMGMGGLAGVSAGSHQECRFVALEYKTKKKNAPTLAFIGKGITFDSGWLSLKPSQYMETMKEDMAGAAAVINAMKIIAQLQPDVNIVGLTPLSENLPSGTATKPGDILTFYNGKTAEVKDTDAEGRLILADALAYAVQHYKPDAMVDAATLTGACAYALGPYFTGMMGNDQDLLDKVKASADRAGDYVWQLPFTDDYEKAIQSDVADMKNIGDKRINAGAITAGFFLKQFVKDTPWVHLDIAGTAFAVPHISYYDAGATGSAVRLFVQLACSWK